MQRATGPVPVPFGGRISALHRWIVLILPAAVLAGCHIEPITPTTHAQPTITPSIQLPLASILPKLNLTATAQPTAQPSPTAERRLPPDAGSVIFRDPLDSNLFNWPLTGGATGTSAFSNGMLAFTVRTPYTSIQSILPRDLPPDLYLEVTATTMLCGAEDDYYGIIFRAQVEPSYRLAVTCSGKVQLQRFQGLELVGAKNWQEIPGLLSGAPAENRVGLLLRGGEFRVFIAGLEAYAIVDHNIPTGGLGLFARTGKSDLLTVAFDDLVVYSLVPQ
jgi:hypothetical protein